jgi:amino acid transporter
LATEATDAPQVFARKATGLRREASARDVFIYNTNNQNIGIGVAFVVLLVAPFYVGASMVVATILAGLLALPMACVYAYFAAAMPRSGGDYIYISRTLHPYLGFLSSWNWMVWLVTYTGIPAALPFKSHSAMSIPAIAAITWVRSPRGSGGGKSLRPSIAPG